MRIQFLATVFIAIYLLVPGYLLLLIARVERNRFLLSYGVSISILILSLVPFLWLTVSYFFWLIFLHVFILILLGGVVWFRKKQPTLFRPRKDLPRILSKQAVIWCLLLTLAYCLYHIVVGPYTEIPSDFWKHLARVGTEYGSLADNDIGHQNLLAYVNSRSSLIYVLQALIAHLLNIEPLDLVPAVTLVTNAIFLASVYWFSFSLFSRLFRNRRWVLISASLATLLTLISFGTATFSYARYYAYFPTIYSFPLIYTSIVILINYLERPRNRGWQLLLIPVFLVVMLFIHRQEVLLTIIILGGVTFVRGARSFLSPSIFSKRLLVRARINMLFFLSSFAVIVIFTLTTREITDWHHTPHVGDFMSVLPIDNPSFRLWDTLGIFGLLVYAWTLFHWRIVFRSDYLVAGMLLPVFTNLNPLYATIFLHVSSPSGIWRTAYLIPLSIVAALLISSTLSKKVWNANNWKRSSDLIMVALLSISLAPWTFQGYFNRTSRIPSLMPVHTRSGADLWMDLIHAVRKIEETRDVRRIFTDEITKFVLYAAVRGQIWWWPSREYFPKNRYTYKEDFSQSDLTGTLLVVNRRNGATTASAQYGRHWPLQALNISRHYPIDLDAFLAIHKDNFELLWASENIAIYQMITFD